MKFVRNQVNLKSYNTFGIEATATHFAEITDSSQLVELSRSNLWQLPKLILGGGSNVLLLNDFNGVVIKMNNKGVEVLEETDTDILLRVQAGEVWHDFVMFCVANGYGGVENLSLIPGSVGASPMQNIGAYGVEIEQVFDKLIAYNIEDKTFDTFEKKECDFGYRSSVFKTIYKDKYVITAVDYRLQKQPKINVSYGAIQKTLDNMNITEPTIKQVSDAVIAIREAKLPNPSVLGNSGSFFKNPIVSKAQFEELLANHPGMPHYAVDAENEKIPAGWLIDQCGFKGKVVGNTGTYKNQALILVNRGGATGQEIWDFAMHIQQTVKDKFGIAIHPEVNLV